MGEPVQSVKDVFERHMPARLKAKPDVVAKINAVYQFNISGPGGGAWSVDCTAPGGAIAEGTAAAARCTPAAPAGREVRERDVLGCPIASRRFTRRWTRKRESGRARAGRAR